jgi:hypothetical protein
MKPLHRLVAGVSNSLATVFVVWLVTASTSIADDRGRRPSAREDDPCGLPDTTTLAYRIASTLNWGYGYDSLRTDIARWGTSPYVRVDSVGVSVQNRTLFMLTIQDTALPDEPRRRVWIHARTHPNEVQGTWVTNQIIAQLLGPSEFSRQMRAACVFNIVPMINPDGVELKLPRQNANNIDIESNWTAVPGEPEVQTLRRMFVALMQQANPIRIALNMHSAYGTTRYFVYHAAAGTSPSYAAIEQRFINAVRSYFPGGIEPYSHFVSWTSTPSLVYPESWFWQNCGEDVLALTYEDMNDASARAFDSTANAILHGIADEFGITGSTEVANGEGLPQEFALEQNFPNPFNPSTTIGYRVGGVGARGDGTSTLNPRPASLYVRLAVYDLLGREIVVLVDEQKSPGTYEVKFDGSKLATGVYMYRLTAGGSTICKKMMLVK